MGFASGRYRFYLTIDDGGRLWVNNHLLIDSWHDQAATTYTGGRSICPAQMCPCDLSITNTRATRVWISMEPASAAVKMVVQVTAPGAANIMTIKTWMDARSGASGLSINLRSGNGSPASGIDDNHFSVRWTRALYFRKGAIALRLRPTTVCGSTSTTTC